MAITSTLGQQICRVYVAAFLRAPDKGGYEYWLNDATARGLSATLNTIFSLDGVKAVYPTSMTNTQFVTAIYNNVFSKSPDAGGLAYWQAFLDSNAKTRGELVLDIINAGLGSPEGTSGRDVIVNRVNYTMAVAEQQQTTGVDLYSAQGDTGMKQIFSTITSDASTVESALLTTAGQTYTNQVTLTDANDKHSGATTADRIDGLMGADSIDGGASNDYLIGGTGNDVLMGNAGNDIIDGGSGDDRIYGGLEAFDYSTTDPTGTDILIGGTGNDTIYGGDGDDSIMGGGNDDNLYGGGGNDMLDGGTGNDDLYGNEGNDYLNGGVGNDWLYGGGGQDTLLGGDGNDVIYQNAQYDQPDNVYVDGGNGNDSIYLSRGNTIAHGGAGNDRLQGGTGDDTLYGDDGQDTIEGGEGRDVIYGGDGTDYIWGGAGDDTIYLTEQSATPDLVYYERSADFGETGDTIHGFTNSDVLKLGRFSLFNVLGSSTSSGMGTVADVQQVSSASTAFSAGKSVFLLQGGLAQANTLAAAATFIDGYGNNQTYSTSDKLLFVMGVGSDTSVYYYMDDGAGDAQVTAAELTHVVTLVGTNVGTLVTTNFQTTT